MASSRGLVITPLLDAITSALNPAQLADASTVFNICQRIAGGAVVAASSPPYPPRRPAASAPSLPCTPPAAPDRHRRHRRRHRHPAPGRRTSPATARN
jgi:hypothetical protein